MDTACDICGGDPNKCEEEQQRQAVTTETGIAYDAAERR
jgi:hypothetical protein